MDIERLTKTQIILLTLLISFVTSIATGIVTVTLLAQAPPALTQTINRVVERTIERVVPGEPQSATVIEKEVTVVVKEDDIITDSIEKNSKSLMRISRKITFEDGTQGSTFVGLGIIVQRDGIIATDSDIVSSDFLYSVVTSSGSVFDAEVIDTEEDSSVSLLSVTASEERDDYTFLPVTLSGVNTPLRLGQTVISLGGKSRTDVSIGIISGLADKEVVVDILDGDVNETATTTILSSIETDISSKNVLYGSPLVDIFGEVIGISAGETIGARGALYVPAHIINSQLSAFVAVSEDTENTKAE